MDNGPASSGCSSRCHGALVQLDGAGTLARAKPMFYASSLQWLHIALLLVCITIRAREATDWIVCWNRFSFFCIARQRKIWWEVVAVPEP